MIVSVVSPRKSIFSRPQFFQADHVVLRHNFVLAGDVERNQFAQRDGGDDHAGRMHSGIAGQSFQLQADVQHFFDAGVLGGCVFDLRIVDGVLQLDVERASEPAW